MQKSGSSAPNKQKNTSALWRRADFQLGMSFYLIFLLSFGLTAALVLRLYLQQTQVTLHEYGNTVARQLAQSSMDAVVRNDFLGLHTQLENLTQVSTIAEAAVYDMENRLLAQSVRHPNPVNGKKDIQRFSAAITFQDSIAGKVIVGLDQHQLQKNNHWLIGYLLCGIVICLLLSAAASQWILKKGNRFYFRLLKKIHTVQPNIADELDLSSTTNLPPLKDAERYLEQLREYVSQLEQGAPVFRFSQTGKNQRGHAEGSYAELLIFCINLETLQQQVHHRELQRLLDNFDEQVKRVTELYHAVDFPTPGSQVLLRFHHDDASDAPLQAVCCAIILRNLLCPGDRETIYLDIRFAIQWHEHDERPLASLLKNSLEHQELHELQWMCRQSKYRDIVVTGEIKRAESIAKHTKLELISGDADVDFYRVQGVSDNYRNVLEQQIMQLTSPEENDKE